MSKEIERKFILGCLPIDTTVLNQRIIIQNYLCVDGAEVRIRREVPLNGEDEKCTLTCKVGEGLIREEIETEIPKEAFLKMESTVNTKPIIKVRSDVTIGSRQAIIDKYIYPALEHEIVEVEFEDECQALQYSVPIWASWEVTHEGNFKNKAIWKSINSI